MIYQNDEFIKKLGARIRKVRKSKRVTQLTVSRICKLKPLTVSDIERGKRGSHILTIKAIADALNVDIKDFF